MPAGLLSPLSLNVPRGASWFNPRVYLPAHSSAVIDLPEAHGLLLDMGVEKGLVVLVRSSKVFIIPFIKISILRLLK